jgi:hypothetical protein
MYVRLSATFMEGLAHSFPCTHSAVVHSRGQPCVHVFLLLISFLGVFLLRHLLMILVLLALPPPPTHTHTYSPSRLAVTEQSLKAAQVKADQFLGVRRARRMQIVSLSSSPPLPVFHLGLWLR